jgi:alpha-amylase
MNRIAPLIAALLITACGSDPAGPGSTVITVATVTVTPDVVQLSNVGQTAQLEAEAFSALGTSVGHKDLTWSSAETSVATVSSSGLVEAVGLGTTTVTATTDGKRGAVSVTVVLGGF